MTRCKDIRPRLSEWIDEALDSAAAGAIERHVDDCADCRGLADDLLRLRSTARAMGPVAPPDAVWHQIAAALPATPTAASSAPPTITPVWQQWVGLAAALVLITLGSWLVSRLTESPSGTPGDNASASGSVETVKQEMDLVTAHYENVLAELEIMATNGDPEIDGNVAATLRDNIKVIDDAIAESQAALDNEPTSRPALASLLEALSQKVNVLQATVTLMNRMRLGDPEGTAEAIAGIGSQS